MPLPWLIGAAAVAAGAAAVGAVTGAAEVSEASNLKRFIQLREILIPLYNETRQEVNDYIVAEQELRMKYKLESVQNILNGISQINVNMVERHQDDIKKEIQELLMEAATLREQVKQMEEYFNAMDTLAQKYKFNMPQEVTLDKIKVLSSRIESTKQKLYIDEKRLEVILEKVEVSAENESRMLIEQMKELQTSLLIGQITELQTNLEEALEELNLYTSNLEDNESEWFQQIKDGFVERYLSAWTNKVDVLDDKVKELDRQVDDLFEEAEERNNSLAMTRKDWSLLIEKYDADSDRLKINIGTFRGKSERLLEEMPIYADSNKVSIAVVAPMSSGKSTLINAILGRELLPSKNQACTATITTILGDETAESFTAELYDKADQLIKTIPNVTAENLDVHNEDQEVRHILLRGPIKNISANERQIEIIDTPGPNNAKNEDHKMITEELLQQGSFHYILYVMNATQIGINDDYMLLLNIVQALKKDDHKDVEDRIFFVLNKCDELDSDDGEEIKDVIKNVQHYLGDIGLDNPKILPVTAFMARLIRQKHNGETLTRMETREYESYVADAEFAQALEQYAEIPHALKRAIEKRLAMAQKYNDKEEIALIHTGVPSLETLIEDML